METKPAARIGLLPVLHAHTRTVTSHATARNTHPTTCGVFGLSMTFLVDVSAQLLVWMRSQYTFGVYMDLNSVDVNTRPPKDKTSPRMKWLVVLPLLFQSAVAFSSLALLPTGNSARVARVERCHGGRQCLAPACATGALGLSSKTIAVFGSTGGVGLEAIYQSLGKGYEVRALARTPTNVVVPAGSGGDSKTGQSLSSTCLSIIQGDVTRYEDVAKVMQGGVDGVVVALDGRTSEVGTSTQVGRYVENG